MESQAPNARPPRVEDVDRIRAVADPVLRNLQITQCYHELALAFAERVGAGANWCVFATWASKQAGQTIRGEDFFAALEYRLGPLSKLTSPVQAFWRWLLRAGLYNRETRLGRFAHAVQSPLDALERASDAVARGNKKVFEEIGREFARFLSSPPDGSGVDPFLAGLRPGDPPEGQRYLRDAFTHYTRAANEPDSKRRAELMLLANLEIGLHEQTRLQPEILEALDSAAEEARETKLQLLAILLPGSRKWWGWLRRPAAAMVGGIAGGFRQFLRRRVRMVVTDRLMTLRVPVDRRLRLGRNLDAPFPSSLLELTNTELMSLVSRFDGPDTGAEDWSVLQERMCYICRLFRALQEDSRMYDLPFSSLQREKIRLGIVPQGEL